MNKVCPRCGKDGLRKNGHTGGGKQRWTCRESSGGVHASRPHCYTTVDPDAPYIRTQSGKVQPKSKPAVFRSKTSDVTRFIITTAQNATPLHEPFFEALKVAAEHLNAKLLIIPIRYKNPTSRFTKSQSNEEVWEVPEEYLFNVRRKLNDKLILLADVKTQPTAILPLTGFESLTRGESGIVPHTRIQFKTIPTPQNRLPKILTTTGAVTVPNYTDSKRGKVGEFHHTLGACLVEIQGKCFHMRQLNADSRGGFYDLNTYYSPTGTTATERCLALIMGDTHVDFIDPDVEAATFGPDGIVETLNPSYLVWHDLLDGYAVNPHHSGNIFNAIAKKDSDRRSIQAEVLRACDFVSRHTNGRQSVIVPSNHDDFLRRWIVNTDWRQDADNAEFYLETALVMVRGTKMTSAGTSYPSPFGYWADRLLPKQRVLKGDESFVLGDIELGMHGDRGPNGARGSVKNLKRIGVKSIIGHSHTPAIEEGCYQVGTSTGLRLEYNAGPSSWLNTHCILYANGKRSLINIIDGEWRL